MNILYLPCVACAKFVLLKASGIQHVKSQDGRHSFSQLGSQLMGAVSAAGLGLGLGLGRGLGLGGGGLLGGRGGGGGGAMAASFCCWSHPHSNRFIVKNIISYNLKSTRKKSERKRTWDLRWGFFYISKVNHESFYFAPYSYVYDLAINLIFLRH